MTKRITNFNFHDQLLSGQDAHISFVGEGANGQEVLLMKAKKQVLVEVTMVDFLQKFYGMWYDDAEALAYALGFDVDTYSDGYEEYLQEEAGAITFMKGKNIPESLPETLVNKIKGLQSKFEDFNKTASSEALNNEEKGDTMPKGVKETEELDLQKSLDQKDAENVKLAKEVADFKKSQADMKEILDIMKADKLAREEADLAKAKVVMTDLVKCFTYVKDEEKEALTDVLMTSGADAQVLILNALDAAQDMLKSALEQEEGEDIAKEDEEDFTKSNSDKANNHAKNLLTKNKKA